jgi:hypothetical protein
MSDVVYATFSTWVTPTVQVEKGQIWDANDPVVRSHPDWFTADPSAFARKSVNEVFTAANATSESMSAAPGEKRSLSNMDQAFDEAASLRDDLEKAGVKVDKRWGLDKLREEYAKATA